MRTISFVLITAFCFLSCKKDNSNSGKSVEIYLLKTYQTVTGKCQVDPSASTLQEIPTIKNDDILEYSQTEHQFKLTADAYQKINGLTDFVPFAVTIDKQVIYYGIFKQYYSSSSCDHSIIMRLGLTSANTIELNLGYPGFTTGLFPIDDQRNNAKLIATLGNQGKLR
jgi:hypothetical protein